MATETVSARRAKSKAKSIVSRICNEARDSDIRADNKKLLAALDEEFAQLEAKLAAAEEGWTDEKGRAWRRPTAWAYAQACKALYANAKVTEDLIEACRYMHTLLKDMGHGGLAGAILGESAIRKAEGKSA